MKTLTIIFISISFILHSAEIVLKEPLPDSRQIEIIKFNNHSYIHYRNFWNSAGDALLHDPDCQCLKK